MRYSDDDSVRRQERANRVGRRKRMDALDRKNRRLAKMQREENKSFRKKHPHEEMQDSPSKEDISHPDGQVTRIDRGVYTIMCGDKRIRCKLSKKLLMNPQDSRTSCAIGDYVQFRLIPDFADCDGEILSVLPRRNKFSRGDSGNEHLEHVLGANLDNIVIFMACKSPETNWGMINRMLVTAGRENIPPIIVINKIDLLNDAEKKILDEALMKYTNQGYITLQVSVAAGTGIEKLEELLRDKVSVLVGLSGTGKSSLLNLLLGGAVVKTGQISDATNKGKHTTTSSLMLQLRGGGYIVDTPGIRTFAMWDMSQMDIKEFFCDLGRFAGGCKFSNCMHIKEPAELCAVKQAVTRGEIPEDLYVKYKRLALSVKNVS